MKAPSGGSGDIISGTQAAGLDAFQGAHAGAGVQTAPSNTFGNVIGGITTGAGLLNTGLGIYNALRGNQSPASSILGSSNMSARLPVEGGARLGGGQPFQIPNTPASGGFGKGGGVETVLPNSKHFDILRQLLGVYTG